ncbi:MAG TPA: SUMF1/EgtB/PvdO family nonheme iron enzyme [Pyrinomonadaceae bacterium]|nr:SUMF1/EgtB/PvdO family nonheme iron enzyme [Pyrinomonadaceae bacterium]
MGRYRLLSFSRLMFATGTFGCLLFSLLWDTTPTFTPIASAQAEMKAYTETIPGSEVKFEMLPIPGGTFTMGSPEKEVGRGGDEGPAHDVALKPFWMGKTEVTWDEYDLFAFAQNLKKEQTPTTSANSAVDAVTRPTPPYADETFGLGRQHQPVISITHHAAMEYCRWLSAKTGKTYRLPTEAEWEYAARAGSKTAYSFGDDAGQIGEYAWFLDNADGKPHEVGKKKPNAWGLYDMHGNVAEWVLDQYDKAFYGTFKPGAPALQPVLLPSDKRYPHPVRGGSWDDEPAGLRSATRRASAKEWSRRDPQLPQSIWWHTEAITVGFRVVRPLDEQENLKNIKSKVIKQSPNY